jgi:iron complex outermembrane receptor protein
MKVKGPHSSAGERVTPLCKPLAAAVAVACGSAMLIPATAPAQESQLEEIVVTATKREEGVQDVPMAIAVLGQQQLEDLNITDMQDYVEMLPTVSFVTLGPGTGNIYIRGVSSGGESSLGANPSVAVYLDEQPVTSAGSYLNPHIYDVSRIEVLAGPQGTTFGANAQSGAIRIITNQPDTTQFDAGINLDGNQPKSGDVGYLAEGFVNVPISDRAAIRVSGFYKQDAGFIDNIAGTHTFSNANIRAGLTDPALIAIAEDITVDNNALAKENFNEATTIGARAALKVDLSENWTATAGVMFQNLESEGVWDHDPTLGDLVVQRWMPDWNNDDWSQLTLTVEGEIFGGNLVATFADLSRDSESANDYSLYSDYYVSYGFVQPYYSCYVSYFGACEDPRESLTSVNTFDRQNFEARFTSNADSRFRWMVGAFYSDVDDSSDNDWHVLGLANIPGSFVEGPDIYWTTNFNRTYEETAVFGEVSFDITEKLTATASARHFDFESTLQGFSGTVWWPCGGWDPGHPDNNYGDNCADENRKVASDDQVYRISFDYQLNDDWLIYTSWGEGYRPGGLNRFCATRVPEGLPGQGDVNIGCAFDSDFLTATEIGFKSTLLDGRMRLNVAAFWQDWEDFQFSRLDTSISPITLTFNVGNAESNGIEGDFSVLLTDNWTLSGAASFVNAELTSDYRRNPSSPEPDAAAGTTLPRVPEFKGNLSSRYTWNNDVYMQGTYVYTGESFNTLFDGGTIPTQRRTQEAYDILNLGVGMDRQDWSAELYVRNVFDERGDVWINAVTWDSRVTINRPRTVGVIYRRNF